MVCSDSIVSRPIYYQSGRGTAVLIHSPASAIPTHTNNPEDPLQDETLNCCQETEEVSEQKVSRLQLTRASSMSERLSFISCT